MQTSQMPAKVPLPFANSGTKNTIPTASQIGITAGAASLTDGFPPLTFTPIASGGVPPSGSDFNGILNMITAIQQWQGAGGGFKYDAAFSTSVGGYPKGATLIKATNDGYWISLVDSNTTNPDTGGANWADFGAQIGGRPGHVYTASDWAYLDKASGLIIQWGTTVSVSAGGVVSSSFPVAFASTCLIALASYSNTGIATTGGVPFNVYGYNAATITMYNAGGGSAQYLYIAIGR